MGVEGERAWGEWEWRVRGLWGVVGVESEGVSGSTLESVEGWRVWSTLELVRAWGEWEW